MGSIADYMDCPNCGLDAHSELYYKTGEEIVTCMNCGYYCSVTIKNRDKRLDELTEDDWETVEIKNPYAAFQMRYYDSPGYHCGTIENEEHLNELKQKVEQRSDIETFTIRQVINGEAVETVIVDNGPKYDSAGFSEEDREMESDDLPF